MATIAQLKEKLKQWLREESTSGAAGGYMTPTLLIQIKKLVVLHATTT